MSGTSVDTSSAQLECPAVLDLAYAPALKDGLLGAIAEGGDVVVRAGAVTQADTACLQLLCAAAAKLAGSGRSLIVADASPAFTRVAARLGLTATLALQPAQSVAGAGPREANPET
jgi:anti-anti-sigma regulatory factor